MFYHLLHQTIDSALPVLLEKSLAKSWRVIVRSDDPARISKLNEILWTYKEDSFLPHNSFEGSHKENQPIYLTIYNENPNQAHVCFVIDGALPYEQDQFKRIVYIFDGKNEDRVHAARALWKELKNQDHDLTYWQQSQHGGWEKKA